jgi:peptidoglycan glycosyltransferase
VNRQIRRVGIVLVLLFLALFAQLNYLQVFHANALSNDPRNTRKAVRDFSEPRGDIVSADGAVLATSVPTNDSFKRLRQYPKETAELFAHITGYFSFTFGSEGVERTYNDELAGRTDQLRLDRIGDLLLDRKRTANVTLTLNRNVQQVARDALGPRKGAVVALDPKTGAVLALWSFPSFDPNPLSAHDQKAAQAARNLYSGSKDRPLLPRAYRDSYFPGSTFKVVTAATGLQTGQVGVDQPAYPVLSELDLPQTNRNLRNFGGEQCGGPLREALRVSCNTAFAQLGLDLGAQKMSDGANAFGFGQRPPLDLPAVAKSTFPDASDFAHDLPALAQSAIGQRDVSATPLEMALVAAGIANRGVIMKPHVLREVRDTDGNVLRSAKPETWLTAVRPEIADQVRDLMIEVVNNGTATRAQIPGIQVAAKTGTAQTGRDTAHAWLVAFAPAEAPRVAVAVIVEDQPGVGEATGGRVAAPIAQAVMRAVLGGTSP